MTAALEVSGVLADPHAPAWATDSARWIRDEVGASAPELGRPGALCPFVPAAQRRGRIFLVECRLTGADPAELDRHLFTVAAGLRRAAATSEPGDRLLLSYLVVYTALGDPRTSLTALRRRVKPGLLAMGLTAGEFYPMSPDTSVRNAAVPVARSPWPALALRHSTPHDELFLAGQPDLHEVFRAAGPGIDTRKP